MLELAAVNVLTGDVGVPLIAGRGTVGVLVVCGTERVGSGADDDVDDMKGGEDIGVCAVFGTI